jgi:hypothetical protein
VSGCLLCARKLRGAQRELFLDDLIIFGAKRKRNLQAYVLTVTGSPCLGNGTAGAKSCCYLKPSVPPTMRRDFCVGNTKNGTGRWLLLER